MGISGPFDSCLCFFWPSVSHDVLCIEVIITVAVCHWALNIILQVCSDCPRDDSQLVRVYKLVNGLVSTYLPTLTSLVLSLLGHTPLVFAFSYVCAYAKLFPTLGSSLLLSSLCGMCLLLTWTPIIFIIVPFLSSCHTFLNPTFQKKLPLIFHLTIVFNIFLIPYPAYVPHNSHQNMQVYICLGLQLV